MLSLSLMADHHDLFFLFLYFLLAPFPFVFQKTDANSPNEVCACNEGM